MRVTVICTIKNEARSVGFLLDSLLAQTREPDEMVIVDGGSTDGAREIVQEYIDRGAPIILLVKTGCNISEGRNMAIATATGEVIASTDAGVRLSPVWLEELVRPFESSEDSPDVVSGFFLPDPQTIFEVAMGATVLPSLSEIDPTTFLPSSRSVAFRRSAWEAVNGYPEWLDYCEDLIFDLDLKRRGFRFTLAPKAVVHFRTRSSLRAFYLQYYRYARGDGKALLWTKRHIIRYSAYIVGCLALIGGFWYKPIWLAVMLAAAGYLWPPYRKLRPMLRGRSPSDWLIAIGLVPVIRLVGDVAKMAGYPVGLIWRLRRGRDLARSVNRNR